jgi:hypothetical protein
VRKFLNRVTSRLTIFEKCWSDLVDGFGKADTESGSDASEEMMRVCTLAEY